MKKIFFNIWFEGRGKILLFRNWRAFEKSHQYRSISLCRGKAEVRIHQHPCLNKKAIKVLRFLYQAGERFSQTRRLVYAI